MDRFESMQYQIAVEGAGAKIVLAAAGLIASAVAVGKIKMKAQIQKMHQYDKEKAAGKVSDKTMRKANKINYGGMPYPKYAEKRDALRKFVPEILSIIKKYDGLIKRDLNELCASKKEFKPFSGVTEIVSVDADDVESALPPVSYNARFEGFDVVHCIDIRALEEYLLNAARDNGGKKEDYDSLKYVASDSEIEAMKSTGMRIIKLVMPKIYAICQKRCAECVAEINKIQNLPRTAKFFKGGNGNDVAAFYRIYFEDK